MKLRGLGNYDGKAVVVLGAGATRGSSIASANRCKGCSLPPLDTDFFTQAQRLQKGQTQVQQLIKDVVDIFGTNFSLTMEGFLTQLEHLNRMFRDHRFPGRPRKNPYDGVRSNFLQIIALLLDETLGHDPDCTYHAGLVRALRAGDVVLNFNYDCLFDNALRHHGGSRWSARDGYGVLAWAEPHTDYWSSQTSAPKGSQLLHLKMHGSLHWWPTDRSNFNISSPVLHLKERWWRQNGSVEYDLIPPEWNKEIDRGVYRHIWRKARRAVRDADAMVFIGYSMPPSDLPVQALMRIDGIDRTSSANASPLEVLVIANPDQESRRRIRAALHHRIDDNTRVLVFDNLEQLHGFLEPKPK